MPDLYLIYYLTLFAAVLGSIGMAALLWFRAGSKAEVRPLILFCLGVAAWVAGHLLINIGNSVTAEVGRVLVNLSPIVSAFFVHFSLKFTGNSGRFKIKLLYLSAASVCAFAVIIRAGELQPWLGFSRYYKFDFYALCVIAVTSVYSLFGYLQLIKEGLRAEDKKRRQVVAVFIAGAWGLLSASGFLTGSLGVEIFPYPVLLLPGYTLFLVYGILRYEFMEVNLWARKSLAWGLVVAFLILAISLGVSIFVRLGFEELVIPAWQVWIISIVALLLAAVLQKPALELATKIVYPGSKLGADVLQKWQAELDRASSWDELAATASSLISAHLGHSVRVSIFGEVANEEPAIICRRYDSGWSYTLSGWGTAAPGVVRTAEVFAAILIASAGRLEQALKIAERETEMLKESHLAELGRLSATVAHEMRNPLNIISMASALCDSETKKEIAGQLDRAGRLINDLLAYSGKMQIEKKRLNLREELDYVLSHYSHPRPQGEGWGEGGVVEVGPTIVTDVTSEISVLADSHRLHQVFFNLLENAFAALKGRNGGRILISAEQKGGQIMVFICDNGPGISEKLKEEIFQPFISGRTGGTGLGLAIVRRIMEAHGGRVELIERDGWECCFELWFPAISIKA